MSMANSLETRAPLLDYRVVEYAASIPSALKLHGREKKHILKQAFHEMLTDDILYRKKMGFSVPLAHWLNNELKPLATGMFTGQESVLGSWFDMRRIEQLWQRHKGGDHRYTQELWSLMAFGLWCREWMDS
jgi:asparagine synthase (glutamine-hydrolysing)